MLSKVHALSKLSRSEIHKYVDSESITSLYKIKLYLDDIYFNTGETSGLTDVQYDVFATAVYKKDPMYVVPVGAKIREGENRVKIPLWLGSMDKYYPEDEKEIVKWTEDNKAERYIVEDKLDGVSCLVIIKNKKVKMYTRGDGVIGADISFLAQYFKKTIPLDTDLTLRGELIVSKEVFEEKHARMKRDGNKDPYANGRNMVSGVIGAKTVRSAIHDIDFVAYEIIGTGEMPSPSDQLGRLDSLGFKTATRSYIADISVSTLESILIERKDGEYAIDGIIIQADAEYERNIAGNPDYAFAFKMVFEGSKIDTVVINVEWNVSKWGALKPRIRLKPVQFEGSVVEYTSGFNAAFIEQQGIGPGAIVTMIMAGEVIPFLFAVKEPVEPQMPDIEYTWNKTRIDIFTEEAGEIMCIKLISSFFARLGIKHVSEATVGKLYSHGYDTLLKIIGASKEDFEKVDTFQTRLAKRTHDNIHNGLQNVPMAKVLGSSGVFGYGIGNRKVEALLSDIPDIFELYRSMSKKDFLDRILQVDGFAKKSATQIVDSVMYAEAFSIAMSQYTTYKDATRSSDSLKGKQIVMTGFRDDGMENDVVDRGGKIVSSVSKKTTALVVSNKAGKPSGKYKKAIDFGVPVYTKEEFIEEFLSD
jgi:DNA ligase (NAD+)